MKVTFLGVGAALDENHTNISMILEANGKNILLDCGYSVPHALWKYNDDPDFLDAIWISHPHADHYFGLGPLICRIKDEGREKPLTLLTRPNVKDKIENVIDSAYEGQLEDARKQFLEFKTFEKETSLGSLNIKTAPTIHSVPNKAIRIYDGDKTFCYSGDGEITKESKALFENADLLVHETFTKDQEISGHSNMKEVAALASEQNVSEAAAVHVFREVRAKEKEVKSYAEDKGLILPVEGDALEI